MNAINQRTRDSLKANPARKHTNVPRNTPITRLQTLDEFKGVMIRFDLEKRNGSIEERAGTVLSHHRHVYEGIEYVWFCVKAQRIAEPIMVCDTMLRGFVSPFIGLREME